MMHFPKFLFGMVLGAVLMLMADDAEDGFIAPMLSDEAAFVQVDDGMIFIRDISAPSEDHMNNPFLNQVVVINGKTHHVGPSCVADRLFAVKSMDVETLEKVVAFPNIQQSVRAAAAKRLKRQKQATGHSLKKPFDK